jgi:3-phosphoglycerate kinase
MMGPNMIGRMETHQQQMSALLDRAIASAKAIENETDSARIRGALAGHLALLEQMRTEMNQHEQMTEQMRMQMRNYMHMMMGPVPGTDTGDTAPQQ